MSVELASLQSKERESLQDHCGIVAAFSPKGNIPFIHTGLDGLLSLQTRGYDGAGFASRDSSGNITQYKDKGRISEVFTEKILKQYEQTEAYQWFLQTRYGTNGEFNNNNVQPLIGTHIETKEQFIVVHNGEFEVKDRDSQESDTLELVKELECAEGDDWDKRIVDTLKQKKGAWSLAIGVENAMYLARDPEGYRPLAYGITKDGVLIAASETIALEKMGIHNYWEVMPGQVLKAYANKNGDLKIKELVPKSNGDKQHCSFENIYFEEGGSKLHVDRDEPEDIMSAEYVKDFRYRSGQILAREAPLTPDEVDMVIGVPGTGIPGGRGYAEACGLPYSQAILDKNGDDERTFMAQDINEIFKKVFNHFNIIDDEIRGKRVVLVDDSIVRGNISKALTELLKEHYGVLEVHWRVVSPPIDKPCIRGINTRRKEELIAGDRDLDAIKDEIGADSLAYLSQEGLTEAQGGFCGCRDCFVDGNTIVFDNNAYMQQIGLN